VSLAAPVVALWLVVLLDVVLELEPDVPGFFVVSSPQPTIMPKPNKAKTTRIFFIVSTSYTKCPMSPEPFRRYR
jgi:hypothetical protein